MPPLLEVQDLQINFHTDRGVVPAVRGVSFSIKKGRTLGVVGESGCGKSVTAMALMRLVREPGKIAGGKVLLDRGGRQVDLAAMEPMSSDIRAIRGNDIAMIFQEPMTALNPVHTIGRQIMEPIMLHRGLTKPEARKQAIDMLGAVGISSPETRIDSFPHELSGGMRQRAMIAMALSCSPSLLIADEPTTALDVTIQAQVLRLMNDLRCQMGSSIIFITHDLGVIAQMTDDVIVMYLGRVVEKASVESLFKNPKHPYTQGLMNSIPSIAVDRDRRLQPIKGAVPNPMSVTQGCGFASRCPHVMSKCTAVEPPLTGAREGHEVACWLHEGEC